MAPSVGPSVGLGAAPNGAPTMIPIPPPQGIDIDALFAFFEQVVIRLEQSILSFDEGLYRDICTTICRSL